MRAVIAGRPVALLHAAARQLGLPARPGLP